VLKPAVIRRPDAAHRTVSTTHNPPPSIGLMAPPVYDADDIHLLIRDLVESGSLPDLCYTAGALSVYRLNDARLHPGQYASWAVASIPFSRKYVYIHMIKCDGAYLYWFVTSTCPHSNTGHDDAHTTFEENACDLYMSHLICLDITGLRTL